MSDQAGIHLRLMTYNIRGGRNDFSSDFNEVIRVVDDIRPDILGLQEVTELQDTDDHWRRWTQVIAQKLNYDENWYFGPTLSMREQFHTGKALWVDGIFRDWSEWRVGNGLVSRWGFRRLGNPGINGRPINIPIFRPPAYQGSRDTDPRYAILSRLELGAIKPYVLVTHLSTLVGEKGQDAIAEKMEQAQEMRRRQCQVLLTLLNEHVLKKGELVFLMADFNAEACEACISKILVEEGGFVRLIPEIETGTHRKVPSPIDHILVFAGAKRVEYRCKVIDSPLAQQASDHLPVVADLKIFEPHSKIVKEKGNGVFQEA